jgi:hypothetical protein
MMLTCGLRGSIISTCNYYSILTSFVVSILFVLLTIDMNSYSACAHSKNGFIRDSDKVYYIIINFDVAFVVLEQYCSCVVARRITT